MAGVSDTALIAFADEQHFLESDTYSLTLKQILHDPGKSTAEVLCGLGESKYNLKHRIRRLELVVYNKFKTVNSSSDFAIHKTGNLPRQPTVPHLDLHAAWGTTRGESGSSLPSLTDDSQSEGGDAHDVLELLESQVLFTIGSMPTSMKVLGATHKHWQHSCLIGCGSILTEDNSFRVKGESSVQSPKVLHASPMTEHDQSSGLSPITKLPARHKPLNSSHKSQVIEKNNDAGHQVIKQESSNIDCKAAMQVQSSTNSYNEIRGSAIGVHQASLSDIEDAVQGLEDILWIVWTTWKCCAPSAFRSCTGEKSSEHQTQTYSAGRQDSSRRAQKRPADDQDQPSGNDDGNGGNNNDNGGNSNNGRLEPIRNVQGEREEGVKYFSCPLCQGSSAIGWRVGGRDFASESIEVVHRHMKNTHRGKITNGQFKPGHINDVAWDHMEKIWAGTKPAAKRQEKGEEIWGKWYKELFPWSTLIPSCWIPGPNENISERSKKSSDFSNFSKAWVQQLTQDPTTLPLVLQYTLKYQANERQREITRQTLLQDYEKLKAKELAQADEKIKVHDEQKVSIALQNKVELSRLDTQLSDRIKVMDSNYDLEQRKLIEALDKKSENFHQVQPINDDFELSQFIESSPMSNLSGVSCSGLPNDIFAGPPSSRSIQTGTLSQPGISNPELILSIAEEQQAFTTPQRLHSADQSNSVNQLTASLQHAGSSRSPKTPGTPGAAAPGSINDKEMEGSPLDSVFDWCMDHQLLGNCP